MKGDWGGECGTRGCTQRSRWISVAESKVNPRAPYRCADCCDEIDAAAQMRAAAELSAAGERENPLLLVLTLVAMLLAIVVLAALA